MGSCDTDQSVGPNQVQPVQSILNSGSYTLESNRAPGSCWTYSLILRDLITGTVIDSQNVYIDNV